MMFDRNGRPICHGAEVRVSGMSGFGKVVDFDEASGYVTIEGGRGRFEVSSHRAERTDVDRAVTVAHMILALDGSVPPALRAALDLGAQPKECAGDFVRYRSDSDLFRSSLTLESRPDGALEIVWLAAEPAEPGLDRAAETLARVVQACDRWNVLCYVKEDAIEFREARGFRLVNAVDRVRLLGELGFVSAPDGLREEMVLRRRPGDFGNHGRSFRDGQSVRS